MNSPGAFFYADRTLAAYRLRAQAAIAEWRNLGPSQLLRRFAAWLPRGARVLDYGCGIGMDLARMRRQGFQVAGIDGALEFVREAKRRLPTTPIRHARFEAARLPRGHYDGIWCNAALMHVPPAVLRQQLGKLRDALAMPCGILGMTLAWGGRKAFAEQDWIPGRYIAAYTKAEVRRLFAGWNVHRLLVTARDGRQGRWIHLLASPSFPDAGCSTMSAERKSPGTAGIG